jgi:hypothetical protein
MIIFSYNSTNEQFKLMFHVINIPKPVCQFKWQILELLKMSIVELNYFSANL